MRNRTKVDRRQLLRGGAAALGGLGLSSLAYPQGAWTPGARGGDERILVLLELGGGNDGLSTLVPYDDDVYARNRTTTRHLPEEVLKLDERFGFHPALVDLRRYWEAGELGIVQGVGYDPTNRSHFKSFDIWHTADMRGRAAGQGWIGRLMDARYGVKDTAPNRLIHVGKRVPYSFYTDHHPVVCFDQPSDYRWVANNDAVNRYTEMSEGSEEGSTLAKLRGVAGDANVTSPVVREAVSTYTASAEYPAHPYAGSLRTIAALIQAGIGARVLSATLTGFDTHADQRRRHDILMRDFNTGLGRVPGRSPTDAGLGPNPRRGVLRVRAARPRERVGGNGPRHGGPHVPHGGPGPRRLLRPLARVGTARGRRSRAHDRLSLGVRHDPPGLVRDRSRPRARRSLSHSPAVPELRSKPCTPPCCPAYSSSLSPRSARLRNSPSSGHAQFRTRPRSRRPSGKMVGLRSRSEVKAVGEGTVRHGKHTSFHPERRRSERGEYVDGERHGPWSFWYVTGRKEAQGEYMRGVPHGTWTLHHTNGVKASSGSYEAGLRIGAWTGWHTQGAKAWEGGYGDGLPVGTWSYWWNDGLERGQYSFQQGVLHGPWTFTDQKDLFRGGGERAGGEYDQGRKSGTWTRFHANDHEAERTEYKQGLRDGPSTQWFANGVKSQEGSFRAGKEEGEWVFYFESGQKAEAGAFAGGRREGPWQTWHESGELTEAGRYKAGRAVELWTTWHASGGKSSEGHLHRWSGRWCMDPLGQSGRGAHRAPF